VEDGIRSYEPVWELAYITLGISGQYCSHIDINLDNLASALGALMATRRRKTEPRPGQLAHELYTFLFTIDRCAT
jgi:hypothetical protein